MTTTADARAPLGWPVWRLAGVIVLGAFLSMLDSTVVAVGLETIGRDLGADVADVAWIANAYLLALAVSLPLCGWLGRRVGVGRLWLWSLGTFTVTSVACAFAGSLGWLIGLRVLQGLAAGLLVPAGQTLLGQAVGPERLGRVMGILGLAVSAGPAIGPALGGVLIETLSWPWLFLINLPIGVVALVAGLRWVPRGQPGTAGRLDTVGLAMIGIGLPGVVYGLTQWGERGAPTSPAVWLPLLVGLLAVAAFVRRSLHRHQPLTDLRLFAGRIYAAAAVTATFVGATMFGGLLLLPLYFQLQRGAGVVETGLSLIVYGLGTGAVGALAGWLTDRYGGGIVATAGGVAVVVTTVPFAMLGAAADPVLVQFLLLLRGAAMGLMAVPPTIAAYAAVRADQLPDATTQVNIVMRVGGALGGAVVTVLLVAWLPFGTTTAFAVSFWALTGASVLGVVAAVWLWRTQRTHWCQAVTRTPAGPPPRASAS